ncbi:hypothetical protein PIB30_073122 [Stylosanthes scabra]|uniref:U-box domain-containing protein n=1 Tax=Stylosanthes scabra TaxID=79078 RepID=A0ABU6QRI1_9FABA|nr:hypothetical protein [Stylosanthes scabra]
MGPIYNLLDPTCVDPSKYFFWDAIHLTETRYKFLAESESSRHRRASGYNEESKKESSSYLYNKVNDSSSSSQSMSMIATNVPDELRCPISLDLMRDPVIVSSGHTYGRNSIAQWINSGHHTCPKSGQRLIHTALIPNYALKSLVQQWCHDNNVPVNEPNSSVSEEKSNKKTSNKVLSITSLPTKPLQML